MTGTTAVAGHLTQEEVRMKMQMKAGSLKIQKWLAIYNAIIDPRPLSEIAMHTGLSEASVCRIIAEYNRLGPEAIENQCDAIPQNGNGSGLSRGNKAGNSTFADWDESIDIRCSDRSHREDGRRGDLSNSQRAG